MKKHHIKSNQKGVTLIELMVAMTLGLILTIGAVFLYSQMKLKIGLMQEIQLLQKKTRIALNVLARISTNPGFYGTVAGQPNMVLTGLFDECEYAQFTAANNAAGLPVTLLASSGISLENSAVPGMPNIHLNIVNKVPNWERISYARDRQGFNDTNPAVIGKLIGWYNRDANKFYTSCNQFSKRVDITLYRVGLLGRALVIDNYERANGAMPILENVTAFTAEIGMADAPDGQFVDNYFTLGELNSGKFSSCAPRNRYMRSIKYTITAQTEDGRQNITLSRVVPFMNADIRRDDSNSTVVAGCPNWIAPVTPPTTP